MLRKALLLTVLVWLLALALSARVPPLPRHGDIVFQDLPCTNCALIQGVTQSRLSHCGIVVDGPQGLQVLEAIGPVCLTDYPVWRQRGRGGLVRIMRLKDQSQVKPLVTAARAYLGRPYDGLYELGGDRIYCSELIYLAALDGLHRKLGLPQPLGTLNYQPYEAEIRTIRAGRLPLQELLISPVALTRSALLETVYQDL